MDSDTDYTDYDNEYYSDAEDIASDSEQYKEFYDNENCYGLEDESQADWNNTYFSDSGSEDDDTHWCSSTPPNRREVWSPISKWSMGITRTNNSESDSNVGSKTRRGIEGNTIRTL